MVASITFFLIFNFLICIGMVKQIYVDLYSHTFTAYQTLPIVKVAFLDDNSAFISDILLCFDKRRSNFNRV